jgi:hypothetical protein
MHPLPPVNQHGSPTLAVDRKGCVATPRLGITRLTSKPRPRRSDKGDRMRSGGVTVVDTENLSNRAALITEFLNRFNAPRLVKRLRPATKY